MASLIYNIPAGLAEAYAGRRVIVRSHDPAELADAVSKLNPENVEYGQLLSLDVEAAPLTDWGQAVPLDLVMTSPAEEFPLLYRFSHLLDQHQIRVTIPVRAGFANAVRLSLALHFAVKLDVGQPGPELIEELNKVLEFYLHRPTVGQPVEYFHSTFLSFFHQEPASLWFIQEEDPEQIRFVSETGKENVSERLQGFPWQRRNGSAKGLARIAREPALEQSECDSCEYFDRCGGYFNGPIEILT